MVNKEEFTIEQKRKKTIEDIYTQYIKYNFSGKTYEIKRETVEDNFPNYKNIVKDKINKDAFNK